MDKFAKKIQTFWNNERYILIFSFLVGLAFTLSFCAWTKQYSDVTQKGISKEVIRFHVLANSDSEEDQNLKIKVKDAILNRFGDSLNESKSLNETRRNILDNLSEIKLCAEDVVKKNGYDYDVTATIERDPFPSKTYGDIVLPAGDYEALRIVLGEGKGHNWWCVMFPPLCFVDVTKGEVTEEIKNELKNILTDEEYEIVSSVNSKNIPVKIKFKVVEWWQTLQNNMKVAKNSGR